MQPEVELGSRMSWTRCGSVPASRVSQIVRASYMPLPAAGKIRDQFSRPGTVIVGHKPCTQSYFVCSLAHVILAAFRLSVHSEDANLGEEPAFQVLLTQCNAWRAYTNISVGPDIARPRADGKD